MAAKENLTNMTALKDVLINALYALNLMLELLIVLFVKENLKGIGQLIQEELVFALMDILMMVPVLNVFYANLPV